MHRKYDFFSSFEDLEAESKSISCEIMLSMFIFQEKSFKLHITDIGLIWFWLQRQISWCHIDLNNTAVNNEKYSMWVEYFPWLPESRALVFTWLFTDITYDSIHSSNDTILKRANHIGQVLKFIQPLWLSFANRLIWRIILGRMIQLQTTTTNHIIDPTKIRRGPAASITY